MDEILSFSVDLARQTGGLLLKYFRQANLETKLKADRSVITEADLAADQFIAHAIRKEFPDDYLLSEEASTSLPEAGVTSPIWIIDPLDGTTNFSLGLHTWGTLITRVIGGFPHTAVMYFPLIDEIYTAQLGRGAYFNDRQLNTGVVTPEKPLSFFACCSRAHRRYNLTIPYKTRILGSAAYTFCLVARGTAVIGFEVTTKIWDIAAPYLLLSETGALSEPYEGNQPFPLRAGISYDQLDFPLIAACSEPMLTMARRGIQPKT